MFQVARVAAVSGAAIVFLLAASVAEAHHAGGIGNAEGAGPINTISASTLEQGHSVAGVSVDETSFDTLSDATLVGATAAGIEDVHGLGTIESYALSFAYGVTNDLMLAVRLPYVRRTGIRAAEDNSGTIEVEDHGTPSGIGDLTVLGEYRFLNDKASRTEAAFLLGVKAPTGATDEQHDGRASGRGVPAGIGRLGWPVRRRADQAGGSLVVRLERALRAGDGGDAGDRPRRPVPLQCRRLLPPDQPRRRNADVPWRARARGR